MYGIEIADAISILWLINVSRLHVYQSSGQDSSNPAIYGIEIADAISIPMIYLAGLVGGPIPVVYVDHADTAGT